MAPCVFRELAPNTPNEGPEVSIARHSGSANTNPQTPPKRRHHHSKEDWEAQKETIFRLYVIENRGLDETASFLKQCSGFETGARKLKSVLKEWNITKNLKASQWVALGGLVNKRKYEDGKDTEVLLDGLPLTAKKLKKELERYASSSLHVHNHNSAPTETNTAPGERLQAVTPILAAVDHHYRSPAFPLEHTSSTSYQLCGGAAMSPLALGDMLDLDREFWTENLNFHKILSLLHELMRT